MLLKSSSFAIMTNKLSSTLDRRSERREKAMPVVKIDSTHPETFFDVLKRMNIAEGAEFEVEKVNNGILLKSLDTEEQLTKEQIRQLLKEEALELRDRDLQMSQEWFHLEQEVWEQNQ
jgi:hypothetical protein